MIFHKSPYVLALYASILHTSAAGRFGGSDQSGASTSVDTAVTASTSASSASIAALSSASTSVSSASIAALSSASAGTSTDSAAAAVTSVSTNVNAANQGSNKGDTGNNNNNNNNNNNGGASSSVNGGASASANGGASASVNGGGSLTLDANAVQTGSQSDGLQNAAAGQAASATDDANFINFCAGKTLTNGVQLAGGSCNGIVMGDIPSSGNMISTIITNPGPGDTIAANQDFNVNVQVANLVAGSFTNPDSTYYAAPQALQGGKIVGHTHVTIQSLGNNIATTTPPDAGTFAFFKGINDAGDGNGGLSATVTGGLPPGVYRVCTMTSASNHQPVTMPLAQRGAQDDCNKFTVTNGGASSSSSGNANANSGGADANSNSNSSSTSSATSNGNSNTNTNTATAASAASSASSTTSAASTANSSTSSNNQNGGRGGRGRGGRRRYVSREFIG